MAFAFSSVRLLQVASTCIASQLPLELVSTGFHPTNTWFEVKETYRCMGGRSHVQLHGSLVSLAVNLLGENTNERTTPCTCDLMLAHSMVHRQRAGDPTRPWKISTRYERAYLHSLRKLYREMKHCTADVRTIDYEEVPLRYTGGKRTLYGKALRVAREQQMRSVGRLMVKWGERCAAPTTSKEARPRAIIPQMSRDEATGQFVPAPILVELPGRLVQATAMSRLRNKDGTLMVAAERTLHQRAKDIINMFPDGGLCVSIDCSSFDGSQGRLAQLERAEFLRFMQSRGYCPRELRKVINQQNHLPLSTRDGSKGVLHLNRASGTAGTSVANKIVMLAALMAAAKVSYDEGELTFYCDGDDTLLFLSAKLAAQLDDIANPLGPTPLVRSWMRRLSQLGLETRVENVAHNPNEVVFCRSRIVRTVNGPVLAKVPLDAFLTQTNIVRHFKGTQLRTYLATLRVGFLNTWAGIPVLGKLGLLFPDGKTQLSLLANGGSERQITLSSGKLSKLITEDARVDFFRTFGIPSERQIQLETLFEQIGHEVHESLKDFVPSNHPPRYACN